MKISFAAFYCMIIGIVVLAAVCVVMIMKFVKDKKARVLEQKKMDEHNKQLLDAKSEAEKARESKARFLAQTSHELRTPLNIIMGMVSLAKSEIDDREKVKDYLSKVEDSSKLLLDIINEILDMSDIEGGKMRISEKKFDFKSQITSLALMFYQQSQKKNIKFDAHMKGVTEDYLVGDELRVNQILMNLLENAMKFTPAGGEVSLTVIQASTSRERVHMRFIVKDSGCGMNKETLERIFQPFEQANEKVRRQYGGSGLGLSITKNLITMMGGTINVSSKENEGTEFVVDIPFMRTNQKVRERLADAFVSYKTLVVADTEEICNERGETLKDMGLSYDTATDGEIALDMIGSAEEKGCPYKLCIIDWKITSMTGRELIMNIRDIFGEDIIIIGATYDLNEAVMEGRVFGANYMVGKPVFRSTLFDALMEISKGQIASYDMQNIEKQYDFSGKRVLLAEDISMNMEVAVKLLKRTGIEVVCTENGKEALDVFVKQQSGYFDCIFLDINMPVMDGYEAAKSIRNSGKDDQESVPIYAMTANAFTEDIKKALDSGMNGHIAKPIETDVLYSTLAALFDKEK